MTITDEMIQDALDRVADTAPDGTRVRAALAHAPWHRSRVALAAAAAVVALLGGGIYGLTSFVSSTGQPVGADPASQGTEPAAGPTGPGCSVVTGTLVATRGSELTLDVSDGQRVTVTTSERTEITREDTGSLGEVVPGSSVFVAGEADNAGERLAAETVAIVSRSMELPGPPGPSEPDSGPEPDLDVDRETVGAGHVTGTVTEVGGEGFTVRIATGTEVEVATTPSTAVVKVVSASTGELVEDRLTIAQGTFGADDTLAASNVQQSTIGDDPSSYGILTVSDPDC